jgi:hypothetical protein
MGYSKLHSSLVASSLWRQPDNVRILFITLLAMCDRHGEVYGTRPGIEHIANIQWNPDEGDQDPFDILMAPDTDSSDLLRNPENEGRRIEEIPGGFRLLNFDYYRSLRNDDDRREQNRLAQERYRNKHSKPPSASVSHGKPLKAHADADADADAEVQEKEKEKEVESSFSSPFSRQKQKGKQPAPYYPPPPPHRIPTDQELETAKRIAQQETQKLKAQLYPTTPIPNTTDTATGSFKLTLFSPAQPADHPPS